MGGGKGSSTTQIQVTPEQQRLLKEQTDFLTGTAFPAYSNTVGGAKDAYNRTAGQAINAASNAMNVSSAAGALQGSVGTGAYQSGVGGTSDVSKYQQALGQGLTAGGAGGVENTAKYQQAIGQGLTSGGAGGVANTANYQQALGQGLTSGAVGQLSSLFSPQYEQQQIQAALQPATEQVREEMNQQGALFGGAGGLGSARQALASQNLASLSQARLGNIAAQTAANVAGQRQQVGEALLGAGQTAASQAGSLYSNLLGAGQTATGQAGSLYGGLLNAGQGATSAAQQGFGSLASLGQQGLSAAQQSAAANIGYAQAPQDIYSKYASVVFGIPQGNTTANFSGTQGQKSSSKGFGF